MHYENAQLIVFCDRQDHSLDQHPTPGDKSRPDFQAYSEGDKQTCRKTTSGEGNQQKTISVLPWHLLQSPGEWRPEDTLEEDFQIVDYVGSLSAARLHNPAVLGFSMSPNGYRIAYGDPRGFAYTTLFPYSTLAFLVRFVHSLYDPKVSISDPRIRLPPMSQCESDRPLWSIHEPAYGLDGALFKTIFVGRPFSRMTTILESVGQKSHNDVRILKYSFVNTDKMEEEMDLYNQLGDCPGWVSLVKPIEGIPVTKGPSLTSLEHPDIFVAREKRPVIVMGTKGCPLAQCSSLSQLVGAIYDVIEGLFVSC